MEVVLFVGVNKAGVWGAKEEAWLWWRRRGFSGCPLKTVEGREEGMDGETNEPQRMTLHHVSCHLSKYPARPPSNHLAPHRKVSLHPTQKVEQKCGLSLSLLSVDNRDRSSLLNESSSLLVAPI
ncbi:hypothetical protein BLNAU_13125 [Blattamonas nauphoetae]|uniref:Uncharacterized protein n=1 Tax=Blattamonas nauphoetae TaxID=2049346 RepID=A0ABQ9XJH8_9EUKA|nr:hypothetical protein BLNAU_13125 [Blattamonas nauphoetae]